MKRRALLYGRVSKGDGGAETRSVDQQLDELRRIAAREHVTIVGTCRDDGVSASRYGRGKAREGWRAVMAAILDGEVDELWVWEVSRATRDRSIWVALINACIAQGVRITISGRVHDPADPDDGFMLDLQQALAVRESAVTSKRIRRDVAARAEKGAPHGRIPYGYLREYHPLTRALVRQYPDPATAPVVAEVVRRVAAREAGYAIAGDLNARGVPSPHQVRAARLGQDVAKPYPWTLEQVHRAAANPVYAGLRVHQGKVHGPGTWDPIVTLAEHQAAAMVLADPGRRTNRDSKVKYLLTGIAVCGVCGSPCRVIKNRGYLSYACWGGPQARGTCCVARRQPYVDDRVAKAVCAWLERPDVVARMRAGEAGVNDAAAQAAAEVAELEQRLDGFYAKAAAGELSPNGLSFIERDLLPRIEDARKRSVPRHVPDEVRRIVGPGATQRWEAFTVEQRRRVVRAVCTVTIQRKVGRKAPRVFDPELVEVEWL